MDNPALQALVAGFQDLLPGRRVDQVESLLEHDYLFRLEPPGRIHLVISIHPDFGGVFPMRDLPARHPPSTGSFAAFMHSHLAGAVLESIQKEAGERLVRFLFRKEAGEDGDGGTVLNAELLGRSANLILTRNDGTVVGSARNLKSGFRRHSPGRPYEPPPPREGKTSRIAGRDLSPCLYLQRKLLDVDAGDQMDRRTVQLTLHRLPHPAREEVRFEGMMEAGEALLGLLLRHRRFETVRAGARRVVSRERKRLRRLQEELSGDLSRIGDPDNLRFQGEAILAGLATARVESGKAFVVNPYDPAGGTIRIDLPDPGRSLAENADLFFRKNRKARRGLARIEQRRKEIAPRAALLEDLAGLTDSIRSEEELRGLEEKLRSMGIIRPPAKKRGTESRRREFRRFRRAVSPDGWIVYVGRNARENDELTFRIASEWDVWLHAAEVPGSHVIVLNPTRKRVLPDATLRFAAGTAAFYSGAREEGRVEVHYAFRRLIRKGKVAGQVRLKRFQTILVIPIDPLAGKQ
ncbi:MAG: NFACT RNA binding domain-containing protein [Acidobacteria bacterium]|nr:NFACT RNA binding domain-containing protein [Acidobacteriota bacterium]